MRGLLLLAAILLIPTAQAGNTVISEQYSLNYQLENAKYEGVIKKKGLFGKKYSFSVQFEGELEGKASLSFGSKYKSCEAKYNFGANIPYGSGRRAQAKRPVDATLDFGGVSQDCPFNAIIEFSRDIKKGKIFVELSIMGDNTWDSMKVYKGSLKRREL